MNQKKRKGPNIQSVIREAFFKLHFEQAKEAVFVLTQEGEIVAANNEAEKLLGYSAQEMRSRMMKEYFSEPAQWEPLCLELQNNDGVNRRQALLIHREGTRCRGLISLRSILNESGHPFLIVATFSQKTRAESLRQKERNFVSAILETTGALVVLLDPQYRFIRINDAFERLTGLTIVDLLGNFVWDTILPKEEVEGFKAVLEKTGVRQPPQEHRCRITGNDGREFVVIWTVTVMVDEDDKPEYLICTGIDVTELQEALQKIKILSGLLPICSFCKKIRDDQGSWKALEEYIRDHSEANFSHGLCPECIKTHYPQYSRD